jgi:hypothetical protein
MRSEVSVVRPPTASASTARCAHQNGSERLRSDGMLASSASGPQTLSSQSSSSISRSTSVTFWYHASLPFITAS